MLYIIATTLRKAIESRRIGWGELMLEPRDYDDQALFHPLTRKLMDRIEFRHGGAEYDAKYPDGIPTTVEIEHDSFGRVSSGLVMYPEGHARCPSGDPQDLLELKFSRLAGLGVEDWRGLRERFGNLRELAPDDVKQLYAFPIRTM